MHRLFRKLLDDATGESQSIITVIVDIRGFSAFSRTCESPDTAMFVKRVYIKLIDVYFPYASFYKSTGDGLLLTIPYGEKNLQEISQKIVGDCLSCHAEFANICNGDSTINFQVPAKIGIGIARGTACCLKSGKNTIDYSGRLLNLTSRLTDLARPSGIVIDGAFIIGLLTKEQQKVFYEDKVYLKGIAEDVPIKIHCTKEFTIIPKYNKQPIAEKKWQHKTDTRIYRELLKSKKFIYTLDSEATSSEDIKVTITHPSVKSGRVYKNFETVIDFSDFTYKLEAGKPMVVIDFEKLCARLARNQVKQNMNVKIDIAYVVKSI